MNKGIRTFLYLVFLSLIILLTRCAPAVEPTLVEPTTIVPGPTATTVPIPTTLVPSPITTVGPTVTKEPTIATPTPSVEERFIEIEWPPNMRLGDSDIVRMSLIPTELGYVPQVEFEEHEIELEPAAIPYRPGYEAYGIARMNAVGLDYEPVGDQVQKITQDHALNWRWTISPESVGIQRLSLELRIRWEPLSEGRIEQVNIWDSGLEVNVRAPLGVAAPQARLLGLLGIFIGSVLALPLAELTARRRLAALRASRVRRLKPNTDIVFDVASGVSISSEEQTILQALYNRYARVTVETRYSSGYSGARTLLVQPTRPDGRTDAFAIVKIGSAHEIQAEYSNYENFVRHTLPPVTSRVQGPPVIVNGEPDAALEYTFVGMPGISPTSLRTIVLESEVSKSRELIEKGLFATFGPGWWMQRVPYSFRMGSEYDHLLPVHVVLEVTSERKEHHALTGSRSELDALNEGEIVRIENAVVTEVRPKRSSVTISWIDANHTPNVRVRFQNIQTDQFTIGSKLRAAYGQVVATRKSLLKKEATRCFPDHDLETSHLSLRDRQVENPFSHLKDVLEIHQHGTRSIIHGDLNLENILVGPGDLVWLIDFASTREGHTLFDFARLEAELTTQAISEIFVRAGYGPEQLFQVFDCLELDRVPEGDDLLRAYELLHATRLVAGRLLFDPGREAEFHLSLYLAYLGTLKFSNLDDLPHAPLPKTLAFAAAAYIITKYLNSK